MAARVLVGAGKGTLLATTDNGNILLVPVEQP